MPLPRTRVNRARNDIPMSGPTGVRLPLYFAGTLSSEARSALEQKLSGAARKAGAHEVERPLLLNRRCQLLLAHLGAPGRALWPDELLLLVESLDQSSTSFPAGEFFRIAHLELLPLWAGDAHARYGSLCHI